MYRAEFKVRMKKKKKMHHNNTSIGTDRPGQTVLAQIRCHRTQHLIKGYTIFHSYNIFYINYFYTTGKNNKLLQTV